TCQSVPICFLFILSNYPPSSTSVAKLSESAEQSSHSPSSPKAADTFCPINKLQEPPSTSTRVSHWFAVRKPLPPSPPLRPSPSSSRLPPICRALTKKLSLAKTTDQANMSYGIPPNQTDQATAEATTQAAHVDQLLADVAWMEESMRKMMSLLDYIRGPKWCQEDKHDNTDKKRGKRTMMEKIQWTKQSHKEGL
ncbi:hypothetical protein PCASD_21492, partial [Puccinia coronata f. sp. avenae]